MLWLLKAPPQHIHPFLSTEPFFQWTHLYDAQTAGTLIASGQAFDGVDVVEGTFTLHVIPNASMNEVFNGGERWIEVQMQPAGSAAWTTLPRQPIAATPYAWGLRPGARIESNYADALLTLTNTYNATSTDGEALRATSGAPTVPTIYAHHIGDGPAIYGYTEGVYPAVEGFRTDDGIAIGGYGRDGIGVYGSASGPATLNYGVRGRSSSPNGYAGHFVNASANGIALYAEGSGGGRTRATLRVTNTESINGMAGYLTNNSNYATAHFANWGSGQVLWLENGGTGTDGTGGGDFITAVNPDDTQFRVLTTGEARSDVGFTTPAADFAEMLPAVEGLEPGDVLSVGDDGRLTRRTMAFETQVVGVYSTRPGFVGGHPVEGAPEGQIPLAIVGVVPVKACDENGPIRPGDRLVASSIPGYAMRAADDAPQGSVIGKALAPLDEGTGTIQMLVTLQ